MEDEEKIWHREVIGPEMKETLQELQQRALIRRFYLAGGTALALHLGHRRSRDLDFFSTEPVNEDRLHRELQECEGFSLIAKERGTVHAHIGGVKVSFLEFTYPVLFSVLSFCGSVVADPRDIACMKVSAVAGRGTKRDFVDLYAAAQQHGLASVMELFAQKFAKAKYSRVHVLKSLTYFEDAEMDPMPDMLIPLSWAQVRTYFETEAPRLL